MILTEKIVEIMDILKELLLNQMYLILVYFFEKSLLLHRSSSDNEKVNYSKVN